MAKIKDATFVYGADRFASLPKESLPEVAFMGKSNVGKSSLINRLTHQGSLARTSNTPGRTQQLNFFECNMEKTAGGVRALFLVDLPGFGFAKLSHDRREELSEITVQYLTNRSTLKVVCLLNDIRREPGRDELAIRDLVYEAGKNLIVVLTKCDKLSRGPLNAAQKKIAGLYGLDPSDLILTGEKIPCDNLLGRVLSIVSNT